MGLFSHLNFQSFFQNKTTRCGFCKLHILLLQELGVKKGHRKFRHSCASGVFDGYWYSFITMLTVGYGDKVRAVDLLVLYTYFCNKYWSPWHWILKFNTGYAFAKQKLWSTNYTLWYASMNPFVDDDYDDFK